MYFAETCDSFLQNKYIPNNFVMKMYTVGLKKIFWLSEHYLATLTPKWRHFQSYPEFWITEP